VSFNKGANSIQGERADFLAKEAVCGHSVIFTVMSEITNFSKYLNLIRKGTRWGQQGTFSLNPFDAKKVTKHFSLGWGVDWCFK
jgi:hypothetical protein